MAVWFGPCAIAAGGGNRILPIVRESDGRSLSISRLAGSAECASIRSAGSLPHLASVSSSRRVAWAPTRTASSIRGMQC